MFSTCSLVGLSAVVVPEDSTFFSWRFSLINSPRDTILPLILNWFFFFTSVSTIFFSLKLISLSFFLTTFLLINKKLNFQLLSLQLIFSLFRFFLIIYTRVVVNAPKNKVIISYAFCWKCVDNGPKKVWLIIKVLSLVLFSFLVLIFNIIILLNKLTYF